MNHPIEQNDPSDIRVIHETHETACSLRLALVHSNENELAARLGSAIEYSWTAPATVLVISRARVGTTTLLNAVLGRPGLLPTDDFRETTRRCVTVGRGDRDRALVDGEREIGLDELGPWLTGAPGGFLVTEDGPVQAPVAVELANPLLDAGIRLVEAPGLEHFASPAAAAELARRVQADAILFVLDSSVPMSPAELDVLTALAPVVDTVLVALTKIDTVSQWEWVRRQDDELIRRRTGRPSSSTIFATSATDPVGAAGLADLEAALRDLGGGAQRRLRSRSLARTGLAVIAEAVLNIQVSARAARGPEAAVVIELEAELDRLRRFQELAAPLREALEHEVADTTAVMAGLAQDAVDELTGLEGRIATTSIDAQRDLGHRAADVLRRTDRLLAGLSARRAAEDGLTNRKLLEELEYPHLASRCPDLVVEVDAAAAAFDPTFEPHEVLPSEYLPEVAQAFLQALGRMGGRAAVGGAGLAAIPAAGAALAAPALPVAGLAVVAFAAAFARYADARDEHARSALEALVVEALAVVDRLARKYRDATGDVADRLWRRLCQQADETATTVAEKLEQARSAHEAECGGYRTAQELAQLRLYVLRDLRDRIHGQLNLLT
jgi:hypothetical protein